MLLGLLHVGGSKETEDAGEVGAAVVSAEADMGRHSGLGETL